MEKFVKGYVVVIPFPFSDLSASKKRPALVVSNITGDDIILCQITSVVKSDEYSIYRIHFKKHGILTGSTGFTGFQCCFVSCRSC
jgi:hypothetical protein